ADLQLGELLAMPLALLIVLATAHLEDLDLVVLAVCHHSGCDSCAGHQGRADLDLAAVSNGKNLVKHDFLAYVRSNLFYFNFFAGSNAILLAPGFYDRVHVDLLKSRRCAEIRSRHLRRMALWTDFRRAQNYSIVCGYSQR